MINIFFVLCKKALFLYFVFIHIVPTLKRHTKKLTIYWEHSHLSMHRIVEHTREKWFCTEQAIKAIK